MKEKIGIGSSQEELPETALSNNLIGSNSTTFSVHVFTIFLLNKKKTFHERKIKTNSEGLAGARTPTARMRVGRFATTPCFLNSPICLVYTEMH